MAPIIPAVKIFIFYLALLPSAAFAGLCPPKSYGSLGGSAEDREYCQKFQKSWLREYGLKRAPYPLVEELEGLYDRTDESIQNAQCIDKATKRAAHLTEAELAEIRQLNAQNLKHALRDGIDRGRLMGEAERTFLRLSDLGKQLRKKPTARTRDTNQAMREPVIEACARLINSRYKGLLDLQKQLPASAPAKEPGHHSTPGGGTTL